MKRWILFTAIVAPIVSLLAFGLTRDPHVLPSAMTGKKAPAFTLQTLEGKTVSSEDFRGAPFVVNFWATWCGACLAEQDVLREAQKAYADTPIKFLNVVYQDDAKQVKKYLKKFKLPMTALLDSQSRMAIDYGVGGIPETFFVDAKGVIQEKFAGPLPAHYLENQLEALIVR